MSFVILSVAVMGCHIAVKVKGTSVQYSHTLTEVVSLISDFSRKTGVLGKMVTLKRALPCHNVKKQPQNKNKNSSKQDFSGMLS